MYPHRIPPGVGPRVAVVYRTGSALWKLRCSASTQHNWHDKETALRLFLHAALILTSPLMSVASVPAGPSPARLAGESAEEQRRAIEADYRLACDLARANGGTGDYSAAARLYLSAAEAGYAPAQYDLGNLYENGLGVARDLQQAARWYQRAAEQGDAKAQNNLGTMYANGRGVPHNDRQAVMWYSLAASQEDLRGVTNLGSMYLYGKGVARDEVRAFQLYRKAAEQGYAVAQHNLAVMYATGQAVSVDCVRAYAWFDLASEQLREAGEWRDKMVRDMSADELNRARELAGEQRRRVARTMEQR